MDDGGTWSLDFALFGEIGIKVPIPMGDQGAIATFGFPYFTEGNAPPPPVLFTCDRFNSNLLCDYEGLAKNL